ncbi:hypothetical protein PtrM4_065580 [Pyrenophora tritici-repentis]|uniref:Uncharacterized protein n=1 Tax=Pyrenophora tritici-repentis TaxID=45151 RepID=A0A834S3P2_9PLEO|nr:hypothetical protein PtrM4_065580 [Pyrenophora tritici-repentis]
MCLTSLLSLSLSFLPRLNTPNTFCHINHLSPNVQWQLFTLSCATCFT